MINGLSAYRQQWFGNIKADLLSGLVVALALIPEAIAFSIIAGVDPKVGLYASFSIALITAIAGGHVLCLEGEVFRDDGVGGQAAEGAGGREC